ncbi:hypothetical protein [Adhaeribacter soli]|uniref:Outer membrane beta-barrel protein n=1 Tax=Adhaeribacter soli TaxID=2607655 RepID=A0A5N1J6Z9_9BACT|nr:hypothetical protein [Adhaeribacter soli]KAA9340580.1 hypothetical protein F0P94_03895 [Adhaeribacter soli]
MISTLFRFFRYLLLGLPLGFTNCKSIYYTPFMHQVPLLKEEDDFVYSGGISVSENETYMAENSYAGSISDKIGIVINNSIQLSPISVGFNMSGGAGYFKPVNAKENLIFETYGGLGYNMFYNETGTSNFYRIIIQPDFGFRHKYVEAAVATRMVAMYSDPSNKHRAGMREYNIHQAYDLNEGMYYIFEPGFVFRFGLEHVKLQVQVARAAPLTSKPISYDRLSFNFGITVRN